MGIGGGGGHIFTSSKIYCQAVLACTLLCNSNSSLVRPLLSTSPRQLMCVKENNNVDIVFISMVKIDLPLLLFSRWGLFSLEQVAVSMVKIDLPLLLFSRWGLFSLEQVALRLQCYLGVGLTFV